MATPNDAERLYQGTLAERDALLAQQAKTQARIRHLNSLLDGLRQVYPDLRERRPPQVSPDLEDALEQVPRGQTAVLRVFGDPDFAGRYWTVTMVAEELRVRGWLPDSEHPENAIRAAIMRLVASDKRVHRGIGRHGPVYYFQPEGGPPPRFDSERGRTPEGEATT